MSAAKKGLKWSITSQWWHYSLCNSNYDDSKDLICNTIMVGSDDKRCDDDNGDCNDDDIDGDDCQSQ